MNCDEVLSTENFLSVMEPLLLEDYKYSEMPQTMKNILTYLKNLNPNSSKNDILICLIYILFLETGFVPNEDYVENSSNSTSFNYSTVKRLSLSLPRSWKSHNKLYNFTFVLPLFPHEKVYLTFIVLADDILVNCVVKEIEGEQFTTCLDPLLYFSSSQCDINSFNLQNIKHLSHIIKDNVSYHAKQVVLQQNRVISECFEQLPPEIVLQIMNNLDFRSLISLGQVNSLYFNMMKIPKLWMNLLWRDYPKYMEKENSKIQAAHISYEDIRDIYKQQYLNHLNYIHRIPPSAHYLHRWFNVTL